MSLPGTGTGWDKIDPKKSKPFLKKGSQERKALPKKGLKENVIVGRLVPAGTGLTKIEWDKQARDQDKARLEELKKQELESAPIAPEQTS